MSFLSLLDLHGSNICYVEFSTLTEAKSVIWRHLNHPFTLNNQQLFVNYAVDVVDVGTPTNLVWVTGLDTSARPNLSELTVIFARFGHVENILLSASPVPHATFRAHRL